MEGRCLSPRRILVRLGVNDSILKFFQALFGKVNGDLNLTEKKYEIRCIVSKNIFAGILDKSQAKDQVIHELLVLLQSV